MTAHMSENLMKLSSYFKPTYFYWQLTPPASWKNSNFPIGRYPLNMIQRIKTGHYYKFDENGLPLMISVYGRYHGKRLIHYYTTLSSFAYANWDLYIQEKREENKRIVIKTAEYIMKTGIEGDNETLLLRCEGPEGEHSGPISAMDQGMAIGVLVRAWLVTNQEKFLNYAFKAFRVFNIDIQNGGVLGWFSKINDFWFEEDTEYPLRHILNGKIYAIWGIKDLFDVTGDPEVGKIYEKGLASLSKGLSFFDNGFWSWYWYPEDGKNFYIASMMYQNLHICQLKALYLQTGISIFKEYYKKFENYARNPWKRLKAGWLLLNKKIFK